MPKNQKMNRFHRLILAMLVISLAVTSPASAAQTFFCSLAMKPAVTMGPADPDAPAGAPSNWLPAYDWVRERWVPFNEVRLYQALGLPIGTVAKYLYTYPAHSLEHLARSRGISPQTLLAQTMGSRPTAMPISRWRTLRRRTLLVLSQPHLSQHMLFHPFHITQISGHLAALLGVSQDTFLTLYERDRRSLSEIAHVGGRSESAVRAEVLRLARVQGSRGVTAGFMAEGENGVLQDQDRRDFDGFWNTRYGR
jgi:hypothetical protein